MGIVAAVHETPLTDLVVRQPLQSGKETSFTAEPLRLLVGGGITLIRKTVVEVGAEQAEWLLGIPGDRVSDFVAELPEIHPSVEMMLGKVCQITASMKIANLAIGLIR